MGRKRRGRRVERSVLLLPPPNPITFHDGETRMRGQRRMLILVVLLSRRGGDAVAREDSLRARTM